MLTTIEAEIDVNGQVTFLEPLKITRKSRAIVTILDDETPKTNGAPKEAFGWWEGREITLKLFGNSKESPTNFSLSLFVKSDCRKNIEPTAIGGRQTEVCRTFQTAFKNKQRCRQFAATMDVQSGERADF